MPQSYHGAIYKFSKKQNRFSVVDSRPRPASRDDSKFIIINEDMLYITSGSTGYVKIHVYDLSKDTNQEYVEAKSNVLPSNGALIIDIHKG